MEDSRVGLVEGRSGWLGVRKGIGWFGVRKGIGWEVVRSGRDVSVCFSAEEFLGELAGFFLGAVHVGLVEGAAAGGRSLGRL